MGARSSTRSRSLPGRASWTLAVVALVLAACGGGPPTGWAERACGALAEVNEASADWQLAGQAIEAGDREIAETAFASIAERSEVAVGRISELEDWQPGERLAASTYQAAADYITAVELYRAGDVTAGTNALDSGDRALDAANGELQAAEQAGLSC